tara:strand:+ start:110 stop:724 length:615 start_codon:yes stop_codon:yes gene_type:complete
MRIKRLKPGYEKLTKEKARIIAHLIGDGAHLKTNHDYVLKYEVRDEDSLKQFNDDLIEVYGLKPSWEVNTSGITGEPIDFVRLRSKLAYEDLLEYATYFSKDWKLKKPMFKANKKIKKEFLRALYDDEGSVKSKYQIALYSINENGLRQIKDMLEEFNISSVIYFGFGQRRNVFGLIVTDFKLFNKKIGFSLKRKQEKLEKFVR